MRARQMAQAGSFCHEHVQRANEKLVVRLHSASQCPSLRSRLWYERPGRPLGAQMRYICSSILNRRNTFGNGPDEGTLWKAATDSSARNMSGCRQMNGYIGPTTRLLVTGLPTDAEIGLEGSGDCPLRDAHSVFQHRFDNILHWALKRISPGQTETSRIQDLSKVRDSALRTRKLDRLQVTHSLKQ